MPGCTEPESARWRPTTGGVRCSCGVLVGFIQILGFNFADDIFGLVRSIMLCCVAKFLGHSHSMLNHDLEAL